MGSEPHSPPNYLVYFSEVVYEVASGFFEAESLWSTFYDFMVILVFKKRVNASRPSEHPPLRGKMSKRLGGIIGCKYKTSSWHLPPMVVTLDQQHHTGEKPTVILYTYINRHAETPEKNKAKTLEYIIK